MATTRKTKLIDVMNSTIEIKELCFHEGSNLILDNVTFNIPRGKICAFIGPNGAGKTTTIKCIVGLYKFKKGTITINNIDNHNPESLQLIGYVPEKENFPKMTPKNYFCEICQYNQISLKDGRERLMYLIKEFGLQDIANNKLSTMSSGQKKKMLIIQSLLHNPDILIMDEPTDNMDPTARMMFFDLIKKLKSEGKTLFISSHNLSEIERYVDYVIMIVQGKIVYAGAADQKDLYKLYNEHTGQHITTTN